MPNKRTIRADDIGEHRTAFDHNKKRIMATQTVCGICGQPVNFEFKYPHPLSPCIDHIIPIAKGGHPSDISNLQLAHRWCNRLKSDKLFDLKGKFQKAEEDVGMNKLPLHYDWKHYKGA